MQPRKIGQTKKYWNSSIIYLVLIILIDRVDYEPKPVHVHVQMLQRVPTQSHSSPTSCHCTKNARQDGAAQTKVHRTLAGERRQQRHVALIASFVQHRPKC